MIFRTLHFFLLLFLLSSVQAFASSDQCRRAVISLSQLEGMSPNARSLFLPKEFTLTENEKWVLELRFGLSGEDKHTFQEIGELFEMSGGGISAIEKRALKKLRGYLLSDYSSERENFAWFPKRQVNWSASLENMETLIQKLSAEKSVDLSTDTKGVKERIRQFTPKEKLTAVFALPIERLELSFRPYSRLKKVGTHYVGDLVEKTEAELMGIIPGGFGRKSLKEVRDQLLKIDLYLGMNIDWPSDPKEVEHLVKKLTFRNQFSKEQLVPVFALPIERLDLSSRPYSRLRGVGIRYIGSLMKKTESELMTMMLEGFGRKSLKEVKERLFEMGLLLGMNIDWPSDPKEEEAVIKMLNFRSKLSEKELNYILTIPIEKLGLFLRSYNRLKSVGVHYIGDLVKKTGSELMGIVPEGFGEKSLKEVKAKLLKMGLYLGMDINWPEDPAEVEALVNQVISVYALPIETLNLSDQSYQRLKRSGIHYIGDLITKTEIEFMEKRGLGQKSLREVRDQLQEQGLYLGMDIDWPSNPKEVDILVKKLSSKNLPKRLW